MGFRLGSSNKGGTSPGWRATGLLLAAIAVLTGPGLTLFSVFDLIVLAAVSAATTTAWSSSHAGFGGSPPPPAREAMRPDSAFRASRRRRQRSVQGRGLLPPEGDMEGIRLGDYQPVVTASEPKSSSPAAPDLLEENDLTLRLPTRFGCARH
jgi:hypothetical protein